MATTRTRTAAPTFGEPLEPRRLMAADGSVVRGADPADPAIIALVATGTPGDDHFRFVGRRDGAVGVFLNGKSVGIFEPAARFVIEGGDGNDRVTLANTVFPAWVYGGAGDDVITGARGDDVLVGGPGDDRIRGHGGADLVVGGEGTDRLAGGAGADVLVGGPTAYDTPAPADRWNLEGVLAAWSSAGPNTPRVPPAALTQGAFDDAAPDTITGQSATDAFFADTTGPHPDRLRGKGKGETAVEV